MQVIKNDEKKVMIAKRINIHFAYSRNWMDYNIASNGITCKECISNNINETLNDLSTTNLLLAKSKLHNLACTLW